MFILYVLVAGCTPNFNLIENWPTVSILEVVADLGTAVVFDDPNFEAFMLDQYDTNMDGTIDCDEAAAVTTAINIEGQGFTSIEGIQDFVNAPEISANDNNLSAIPTLRFMKGLRTALFARNQFTVLPILNFPERIDMINFNENAITSAPELNTIIYPVLHELSLADNLFEILPNFLFCDSRHCGYFRIDLTGNPIGPEECPRFAALDLCTQFLLFDAVCDM